VTPEILLAACLAHRACCGTEHDPQYGKLHGCCVVCGVPWPCETAAQFLVSNQQLDKAKQREARLREALRSIVKVRFLLGNDPRLNPAYEMGDIAGKALKEDV